MVFGFIAGLVTANAAEWNIHKYLLHEDARKKDSFWRFHWAEHHKTTYISEFYDKDYERSLFSSWNAQSKEAAGLAAAAVAVSPLFPIAPAFTTGIWVSIYNYYIVHKRSHLEPEWGYKYLPWHYDHHMAPDQDKNWCVTFPLWDYVMGTRILYKGTDRERKDIERRLRKAKTSNAVSSNQKVKLKADLPSAI